MADKSKAWKAYSKYIRLRDAIHWNTVVWKQDITEIQYKLLVVKCCTCTKILTWTRMDAGHFIPRGSRGQSGVYFDERNIHAQCGECNGFKEGNRLEYLDFMNERYGPEVVTELRNLDAMVRSYTAVELAGYELMYKQMFKDLLKQYWGL